MSAARLGVSLTIVTLLLGCVPTRSPVPMAPDPEPEPVANGTGTQSIVVQPRDAGAAAYDQAITDMVGECDAVLESAGSTEPPRVSDRRVDLDGDGQDEAIVNVSCEDLSMWRVLTLRGEEAVALLEKIAPGTTFEVLRGPDGRALLVSQHDCCCMYELEVHAIREHALEKLFAWSSGCAPGCDGGSGYEAEVSADADHRLVSIELPVGQCGAEGTESVDLASWTAAR
jgi:hypothetical protein